MTDKRNFRARISGLIPGAGDIAFNRDRNRSVPASRAPRRGYPRRLFADRPAHVLVVPTEGPQFPDWGPGNRNFYYEAYRSAAERWGVEQVSFLDVAPVASADQWHAALIDAIHDTQATHLVTHIEHDPGSPGVWTWDVVWNRLAPTWDGVFLGVMFDSAFDLVTMKSRRMARTSPQFMAVDICMPADNVLIRGRSEVGPVTMPMSHESLALVEERLAGVEPVHDVSFVGALYPYRVELIEKLRAVGLDVAVNPHRSDRTSDFASSRTNQPGWLDYMAGLAGSKLTINFSRSSAGSWEQLKTRVIEATLAGTFLLTDDKDRTRLFFEPKIEYGYFRDPDHLVQVAEQWLGSEGQRASGAHSAQVKARSVIANDFWTRIVQGLARRGLPQPGFSSGEASES